MTTITTTPPRQAAVELGVGVDCEDLARWRALLPRIRGGAFGATFDEAEQAWCESRPDPAASYAGRWCAKEAVVKALWPALRLTPREVRIASDVDGRPVAVVEALTRARPGVAIEVSIAHSSGQAMAFAVALGAAPAVAP